METNLPWVESPFFEKILEKKKLSPVQKQQALEYNHNGYLVLKNAFTDDEIDVVIKDMKEKAFNPDFPFESMRDDRRSQDLWLYSEAVRQMSCKPEILNILEMLYGREPVPFQTLNFRKGSQQKAHSDTIHFSSLPARFMCGVWVALEDVTEENGPLFYYPGSHKTPEYNFNDFKSDLLDNSYNNYPEYENFMEQLMEVSPFEKKVFLAKKGDALIWSSNIIHGGSPVLNENSSRYSQVTHYFFKDCLYYSPMSSNTITGELSLRMTLKNMITGKIENMTYNGNKARVIRSYKHMYLINNHIIYPSFLRLMSDTMYIVKNYGVSTFIKLSLNRIKDKLKA